MDRANLECIAEPAARALRMSNGETIRIEKEDGQALLRLDEGYLWVYQAGDLFGRVLKPGKALIVEAPALVCAIARSSLHVHRGLRP